MNIKYLKQLYIPSWIALFIFLYLSLRSDLNTGWWFFAFLATAAWISYVEILAKTSDLRLPKSKEMPIPVKPQVRVTKKPIKKWVDNTINLDDVGYIDGYLLDCYNTPWAIVICGDRIDMINLKNLKVVTNGNENKHPVTN